MASINLRRSETEPVIDEIIFSDNPSATEHVGRSIKKGPDQIKIVGTPNGYDTRTKPDSVTILRGDLPFLLQAIEKAKELGWI
ncbi:hypothetical protein VPHD148_0096 [Vibrio phage D148]